MAAKIDRAALEHRLNLSAQSTAYYHLVFYHCLPTRLVFVGSCLSGTDLDDNRGLCLFRLVGIRFNGKDS